MPIIQKPRPKLGREFFYTCEVKFGEENLWSTEHRGLSSPSPSCDLGCISLAVIRQVSSAQVAGTIWGLCDIMVNSNLIAQSTWIIAMHSVWGYPPRLKTATSDAAA